jgi:hypothetical protein
MLRRESYGSWAAGGSTVVVVEPMEAREKRKANECLESTQEGELGSVWNDSSEAGKSIGLGRVELRELVPVKVRSGWVGKW